jgi:tetratricopeptide (TPR) repeat protein
VADLFFDHWKKGLGALILFLATVLGVGTWQGHATKVQREASASIAAVDRKMPIPDQLATLGMAPLDNLDDAAHVQLLEAIAEKYAEIGGDSTGAAAAEAWLKAADTLRRLQRYDEAENAYSAALAVGVGGAFDHTAQNGAAAMKTALSDYSGASALYQELAKGEGYTAERALFDLARSQVSEGLQAQAIATLQAFLSRFPESLRTEEVERQLGDLRAATTP